MPERRRGSIRLWQSGLFLVVVVVAMLILSGSLSAGLKTTLTRMAETSELRNSSALAQRLQTEFPLEVTGLDRIREVVAEYRDIYGGGIWVYDSEGVLLESAYDVAPLDAVLESARLGGLGEQTSYVSSDLRSNGWVVASKSLHGSDGELQGVVVTSGAVDQSVAILQAVRDRLWVTFWISFVVAGLLGVGFSELISRRMRALTAAAAAIADGDFEQRLSTGLVPDEIQDLASSYNSMVVTLRDAFGAIQESRQQLAAVIESMAEGVVALDETGHVAVINPEAVRLLGIGGQDVIGQPFETVSDDSDILNIVGVGLSGERVTRTVELQSHVVLLHCTPLSGAHGESDGAVLLLADVTEQRRIEEAQRRFVADASHEMRTPIAALKGMLELLADGAKEVPAVRDDFINTMQLEADRLGRLVADLLTLAKLEAGGLDLKCAPQFPADLLNDVANVMQTLAERAGVALSLEVPHDDLRVSADRDRIVQVLLSFTDNAVKHSPPGATVHLRATGRSDEVLFEVIDEGSGIGAEEVERVFERFYRADTARAGGGGTGLGLAIAKEIVEAHGSHIEVRSTTGAGTTFAFSLPLA